MTQNQKKKSKPNRQRKQHHTNETKFRLTREENERRRQRRGTETEVSPGRGLNELSPHTSARGETDLPPHPRTESSTTSSRHRPHIRSPTPTSAKRGVGWAAAAGRIHGRRWRQQNSSNIQLRVGNPPIDRHGSPATDDSEVAPPPDGQPPSTSAREHNTTRKPSPDHAEEANRDRPQTRPRTH